jgi:transposase
MTIIRIGLDTSKHVFQIHGVDENEKPVLRRQLRRSEVEKFFAQLPPTRIGIEACGASHHWARLLRGLGHAVLLMPRQYIKAYVKRGKNDAIDAEAICEAMSRPTMRFVPVKTAEQQAALTMLGVRDLLVKQRTMLINALRGHAAEFGVAAAKGPNKIAEPNWSPTGSSSAYGRRVPARLRCNSATRFCRCVPNPKAGSP